MKFSQRMGFTPVADVIQVDRMNDELRNGLWNVLYAEEFGKREFCNLYSGHTPRIEAFSQALWADYFKRRVDSRPSNRLDLLRTIREHFFRAEWYEVYDFIEFCVEYYRGQLIAPLNSILDRELSGFRIIGGRVAPITSPEEVKTVQEAIADGTFSGASAHLRAALDLLSKKTNPDYRNSIKESISAVESVSCAITGSASATLGTALKELATKHSLHAALKEGFLKLYGYTSDGDGIRHAMLDEESPLTQADAVYFLVSCSAFVNYLKVKMAT